jgi:thiol-disulfide isomerase/thioredoxin
MKSLFLVFAFWTAGFVAYGQAGLLRVPARDTVFNELQCTYTPLINDTIDWRLKAPDTLNLSCWNVFRYRANNFLSSGYGVDSMYITNYGATASDSLNKYVVFDENHNFDFRDDKILVTQGLDRLPYNINFLPVAGSTVPPLHFNSEIVRNEKTITFHIDYKKAADIKIDGHDYYLVINPFVCSFLNIYEKGNTLNLFRTKIFMNDKNPMRIRNKTVYFHGFDYKTNEILIEINDASVMSIGFEKGYYWPSVIDSILMSIDPTLATKLNKPKVYFYVAPWCGPCSEEIPQARAFEKKLNELGIEMITIVHRAPSSKNADQLYLDQLPGQVVLGNPENGTDIYKEMKTMQFPRYYYINEAGLIEVEPTSKSGVLLPKIRNVLLR